MQNKILIVPCPGNPNFQDDKIKFDNLDGELYLGSEDRMKAAIMKANEFQEVILVGGSESKVTAMYIYFKKKINHEKLICLVSEPDSTGNLAAVKLYLKETIFNSNITIISNKYHLPRLKLIWQSLYNSNVNLECIDAETILKKENEVESLYKKELEKREIKENEGCKDWENKLYHNQEKINPWEPEFWKCEKLILDFETSYIYENHYQKTYSKNNQINV